MADTHVETSDLNQDSLDGAQATVSDVGSAEEFEKETTEDTPSGSHGEAEDENTGDVPDAANGEESREAEDSVAAVTKNGTATEEAEHHVNGNGTADKNGEAAADSTEVDATVGEERKSIVETDIPLSISPKKAMDDVDSAEESQWTTDDTSSESEDEAAAYSRMNTRGGNDKAAYSRKRIRLEASVTPPVGTPEHPHNFKQYYKDHGHYEPEFVAMCESLAEKKKKKKCKPMRTERHK